MKNHLEKHHIVFGGVGALIALAIAILYLFIVPDEASKTSGVQKFILIYAHSICWFLLCMSSSIWAIKRKNKWSVRLAYIALVVYGVFMGTLLVINFM